MNLHTALVLRFITRVFPPVMAILFSYMAYLQRAEPMLALLCLVLAALWLIIGQLDDLIRKPNVTMQINNATNVELNGQLEKERV